MSFAGSTLVDWNMFAQTRAELGAAFVRILGYFREDGVKALAQIEAATKAQNAAPIVLPAHTLKGEAAQFGALPLAELAETIEMAARECVERREPPVNLIDDVVKLGPLFNETLRLLEREANPLAERRPALVPGRRALPGGYD